MREACDLCGWRGVSLGKHLTWKHEDVPDRVRTLMVIRQRTVAEGGCWRWTGAHGGGYAQVNHEGRMVYVTRILLGIEDSEELNARHTCDNKLCVRPDHLQVGTHQQNMQDAVDRARFIDGSDHYTTELTEEDVAIIRQRCASGELQRIVGADYGIRQPTVCDIVNRKTWKGVP